MINQSITAKHTIKLLIFTGVVCSLVFLFQKQGFGFVHSYAWYIIAFFFIQSLLTTLVAGKGLKKRQDKFPIYYFASMILRFVLTVIVAFVFIALQTAELNEFIVNFFILYLLFLIFEIYSLLANLRAHLKKQAKNGI